MIHPRLACLLVLLPLLSSDLTGGIVDEKPLAAPITTVAHAFTNSAAIRPDGRAIVMGSSSFDTARVHRIAADGTILDEVPRPIGVDVAGLAAVSDAWIVLSSLDPRRSGIHRLDDDLALTDVASVSGSPLAIEATDSAFYAVTREFSGGHALWLHVIRADGVPGTSIRLADGDFAYVATDAWGEDALVTVLHGPMEARVLRVLRVSAEGVVADATLTARPNDQQILVAAGEDRALVAIGGDPLELLWLAPDLSLIERANMPYAVDGSIRDDARLLIATSAGFYLAHHQRIDISNERSRMATFSPSGELLEDVEFAPLHLLVENNDWLLASWQPGTIRTGRRSPRFGLGEAIPIGMAQSSAWNLQYVVSGDLALVAWTEQLQGGSVIRMVRLTRDGQVLDATPSVVEHTGGPWRIALLGTGRVAILRSVYGFDRYTLHARSIDLATMTQGEDVIVPLPSAAAGPLMDAEWNGSELAIATSARPGLQFLLLDASFEPLGQPVAIAISQQGMALADVNLEPSGDRHGLFWSMYPECRITCGPLEPMAGGFAVIDAEGVSTTPQVIDGSFYASAVTAVSDGWRIAYTSLTQWDTGVPLAHETRLARVSLDGTAAWNVALERPRHDPVGSLAAFPEGLFLLSTSRLAEVEVSTPRERWIASPPRGSWFDARLLWPDRLIYLATDLHTATSRPFTAAVTTSPATDLSIEIATTARNREARRIEVAVHNLGSVPAEDVVVTVSGYYLCGVRFGDCSGDRVREVTSIAPGQTVRFTFWQGAQGGQQRGELRPVSAFVVSSTTDIEPMNNAATLPAETIAPIRRGVERPSP